MGKLANFSFESEKLLMLYLGGKAEGCRTELHDVVFAVCKNSEELKRKLPEKWFGTRESLHIDSWHSIENVDGYDVYFKKEEIHQAESLYFLNIGYYEKGVFGENHFYDLAVAATPAEAKHRVKLKIDQKAYQAHTDDQYLIEDCIELNHVDQFYICLKPGHNFKNSEPVNGWQRID